MAFHLIYLVAPNVSEQMGGEAIKALQIFAAFRKIHSNTYQITHERCRAELTERLKLDGVYYVRDTWVAKCFWRSIILRPLVNVWFSAKAVRLAEQLAAAQGRADRTTIIHQTEPNSPVLIRSVSLLCTNIAGPLNGNIYYPPPFRRRESITNILRRKLHFPLQRLSRDFFKRQKQFDLLLVAGGNRTKESLVAAGYPPSIMMQTVDCGIPDRILDQPRIEHHNENYRFVHYGRLVYHKGTFLAIHALKEVDERITLDIIGGGPELEKWKKLVSELRLTSRVAFLPWFKSHSQLLDALRNYRGMVPPSLEDANGIVVQEAMALGLPSICLDWGGPKLLIDHGVTGFLITPTSETEIARGIGHYLVRLSTEEGLAEKISSSGRMRAEAWRWSTVASEWLAASFS